MVEDTNLKNQAFSALFEMETMQTWTSGIHDVFCDTTSYPYHQQEYGYSDSSSDGDGAAAQCAYPTTPSDQYENYPQTTAYDNYTTLNPMGYDTPYTNSPCRVQTVLQEPGGSLRDDDNSNSSVEFPNESLPPYYYQNNHGYGPYHQQESPHVHHTEYVCYQSNPNTALPHFGTILERKPQSTKRGRPVTYNKPGHDFRDMEAYNEEYCAKQTIVTQRCKRGAKNILLWKFLLEELRKKQAHIKWEDELDGTFKFVDTSECSRRWGLMKKKEDMNFEKLSRGIRHYYRDGLMSRKDGIRLVYKFNWDRVPRAYRPKFYPVR